MKQPASVLAILLTITAVACGARESAQSGGGAPAAVTIGGAEVSLVSSRIVPEFKPAGAREPYRPEGNNALQIVELRSDKTVDLGAQGISPAVIDDAGQQHKTIFQETMNFQDGHTEMSLLFELPAQRTAKTLVLNTATIELPAAAR